MWKMNQHEFPSEEEILLALKQARRREQNRLAQQRRRANRTPEQTQAEAEQHAEDMRQLRANRTPEDKAKWNAYMREYRAKKKQQSFEI